MQFSKNKAFIDKFQNIIKLQKIIFPKEKYKNLSKQIKRSRMIIDWRKQGNWAFLFKRITCAIQTTALNLNLSSFYLSKGKGREKCPWKHVFIIICLTYFLVFKKTKK